MVRRRLPTWRCLSFTKLWRGLMQKKIAHETLVGISKGSSDSEDFDAESENEGAEDRSWRPSHVVFGKSTIK
jgi:hypothetical protein